MILAFFGTTDLLSSLGSVAKAYEEGFVEYPKFIMVESFCISTLSTFMFAEFCN